MTTSGPSRQQIGDAGMRLTRRTALWASGGLLVSGCGLLRKDGPTPAASTGASGGSTRATSQAPVPSSTVTPAQAGLELVKASSYPLPVAQPTGAKKALVAGPHLAVLAEGGISPVLPATWAQQLNDGRLTDPDLPAAEGEEWLLLQLTPSAPLIPTAKHSATATLTAGKSVTDLSEHFGAWRDYVGFTNKSVFVAISIPQGAPARITITDQGKKATLDVRAMKLGSDPDTAMMMLAVRQTTIAMAPVKAVWAGGWSDGRNVDTMKLEVTFDPKACFLSPWSTAQGWAKQGRMWLHVNYRAIYTSKFLTPWTLDLPKAVGINTGRSVIPAQPGKLRSQDTLVSINPFTVIFDVPVGFTGGTFTLRFPETITIKYREGNSLTHPLRQKGPLTSKLTIAWP